MNEAKMQEIATRAMAIAKGEVQKQIAKGSPNRGMPKARHVATTADVICQILLEFGPPTGEDAIKWDRMVLRAALGGSLLNCSQLRQDLEKAGLLEKETKMLDSEYGV